MKKGLQIVRPREAQRRLGCGHTFFWEALVATGRLRLVQIGKRAKGVPEHELDELILEAMAQRDNAGYPPDKGK